MRFRSSLTATVVAEKLQSITRRRVLFRHSGWLKTRLSSRIYPKESELDRGRCKSCKRHSNPTSGVLSASELDDEHVHNVWAFFATVGLIPIEVVMRVDA